MRAWLAVLVIVPLLAIAWAFLPLATGPAVECRGLSVTRCDEAWRTYADEHDHAFLLPVFAAEVESPDGGGCINSISVQWGPLPWDAWTVQNLC